jgi:hypothetical protein
MKYNYSTNRLESIDHTVKGDFPVDFDLLFDIMYQQSPTHQPAMEKLKKDWLIKLISQIEGVVVEEKLGNIYCTKGETDFYPTIVAHYDTAQDYHEGMRIFKTDKWIFGFDDATGEQCGLGLDDSVGVCFAIQMLKMMPACKVFLPWGEERGLLGTNCCDMSFFDDSLVVTQLDRRSYTTDFIQYTNGYQVWNPEHLTLIEPLMDKYGYKPNSGTATDVGGLRRKGLKVSSHNLSCGYFNEHGDTEIASVGLMINSFSFAYEMLTMLAERNIPLGFPLPSFDLPKHPTKKSYSSESHLGLGAKQISIWDSYDDYYYDQIKGDFVKTESKINDPFYWEAEGVSSTSDTSSLKKAIAEEVHGMESEEELEAYEAYNAWVMSVYPEMSLPECRKELTHLSQYYCADGIDFKVKDLSSTKIDECLMDEGICPICSGHAIQITNDLLLESSCLDCESIFNIPKDMVESYEYDFQQVWLGKKDFFEIKGLA